MPPICFQGRILFSKSTCSLFEASTGTGRARPTRVGALGRQELLPLLAEAAPRPHPLTKIEPTYLAWDGLGFERDPPNMPRLPGSCLMWLTSPRVSGARAPRQQA